MMEAPQIDGERHVESSSDPDVLTVIGPDGRPDPETDPDLSRDLVRALYRAMVRTRIVDEQLVKLQRQGRIGFHIGSLGEEACIIGSAAAFREQDWLFPCYREFGALLYRGMPLQGYVDNMYGNANDPVKGRQMPDHYSGKAYRFGSVSSPIGTQITQAVGFAWAAKIARDPLAVGVYFGEGATSSADFHTGMNFAGVFKTPTVFLCRNNRWAISVPAERQTASKTFADKGIAYGIRSVRCDGNDAIATYETVRRAVARAAAGEGPTLVEMLTYRMGGHSTSDDPRAYRADGEVETWRRTDPLVRLRAYLGAIGEDVQGSPQASAGHPGGVRAEGAGGPRTTRTAFEDAEQERLENEVREELRACIEQAERTGPPALGTMFEDVYREKPWHLREQEEALLRGPRAKAHH